MELLVLHILARALVPVVCGVVLQRVVVGGVGVGEGHIRRLQVLQVDVIVPIAVDGRGHDIRGISRCNRIIAHCVRDGDLLHQHAPDRVVHRPAVLAGVHLLNKRALAEHDPERPLGAGEGQRAVIAALAVGGDGAGDGHIRFILIGCAVADERQRKGLLTGYANVTQSHRGGVGHGQGDDLFKNGVQGHIRVLGIGIAQTIGRAGLFVDPAGLDEAVHGEGLAAQGEILAVGLDVRHRIAALAAVIGDGVLLHRAAAADAVHIDVLRRDLHGLGSGHGRSVCRISMCGQCEAVRLQIVPIRGHHAVSHAVGIHGQIGTAALHAGVIAELLVEGHAVRGRDSEFVLLPRADHIRAVDGDGIKKASKCCQIAFGYHAVSIKICGLVLFRGEFFQTLRILKTILKHYGIFDSDHSVKVYIASYQGGSGRLRRRAEFAVYLELNRHTISGCNRTIFRRLAVHGDSRRQLQTFVVQTQQEFILRAGLKHFGFIHAEPLVLLYSFIKNVFFPVNILNIVGAEGDARDRGFEAVSAVGRRLAHLEAVDRDGEAALHLIDGVKGHVSSLESFIGRIDRPGDALLPAHEFVGRAVLDLGEVESIALQNCENIGVFCLRLRVQISVLEIQRDRIVVIRKGRHRAEHQHHAKGKQNA